MKKIVTASGLFALLIFGGLLIAKSNLFSVPANSSFKLFFTGDVYGYLRPCG